MTNSRIIIQTNRGDLTLEHEEGGSFFLEVDSSTRNHWSIVRLRRAEFQQFRQFLNDIPLEEVKE